MGDQQISPLTSQAKRDFLRHLLDDISALERMIAEGMIESGKTRIGAEQEYCLVRDNLRPALTGPEILQATTDAHFTSELARWNLEINLDPQDAGPGCLTRLENQLLEMLETAHAMAARFDSRVVLTGILPTIRKSELDFNHMTPNPRYQVLDNILKELRGEEFTLNIEGVDEFSVKAESILYEACNTSFQIHLQIDPKEFADMYNWAQVIAAPVLACSVNSPLLLGKELWMETRIALFRQSLDIRHAGNYIRDKQPRVAFGYDWLRESVVEIFRDDIAKYRLLISADIEQNSLDVLDRGEVPELRAMNLHNGTLYKWNRACYGIGGGIPHLRIENRYVPSGPTPQDEMANTVFWVGLMLGLPDDCRGNWKKHFHFRDIRHNFLKAAQHGLSNEFSWFGRHRTASEIILDELLPLAANGLSKVGIPEEEFGGYLATIEARVRGQQTGADWIVKSMRNLRRRNTIDESMLIITHRMNEYCREGVPVHQWEPADGSSLAAIPNRYERVDSIMSGDVVTVRDDDLLDFASSLMDWYDYKRLPVENARGQVRGVITRNDVHSFISEQNGSSTGAPLVSDCMTADVLTISPEQSLDKAEKVMIANEIGSLPVVRDDRIIGIITADDIRETRGKMNSV
ncbi:MAG: CBS domain-containing protein [Planctomycetota bacterium]